MSDMLDNILTRNFQNCMALDDAFLPPQQPQHKAPGSSRLNRSVSFFSSPSPSSSSSSVSTSSLRHISLSTEHVNNINNDVDNDDDFWPADIWSRAVALSRPQPAPLRCPDRSMSLTESSSSSALLLSSLGSCLKGLECSSSSSSSSCCSSGGGGGTGVAPPPGFPPLSSSSLQNQVPPFLLPSNRYKTELCRGFQESGSCKYGSKCQFAHGEDELRGLFRHPKYKTEHCRTFYNFGYCPYGTRCHFIHEEKASGVSSLGMAGIKFGNHARLSGAAPGSSAGQNPRHQLRQSVSFAGFLGASRSSPPPSMMPPSFNNIDPNLGFSRAPSVSPPPADLLSPMFGHGVEREAAAMAFQFGHRYQQQQQQRTTRASTGDIHAIPEPMSNKPSRCVCGGHGNPASVYPTLNPSNSGRAFQTASMELDGHHNQQQHQELSGLFASTTATVASPHGGFMKAPGLQRFSSEDSLEDSYSSSSGGSSGTESPTFDGNAGKRLTVFARLSLSD